ncbi:hypothetical protein M3P05_16400 [Sansalvadorimonas sp. 2012CJ34-2]|uniref:Uncharacterized protein n=1 Tax=Parendozoicomonas callyspongiae TaxID=2942213 RepID=A0ABT0PJU2_9GAMM|nr:hypothetical protein [Sansalvadorimonas sp. 2012CJ34-2]MCL6271501.1 hypothetical protein [Sansalvadorimonas sp. 2012CJ34-2]
MVFYSASPLKAEQHPLDTVPDHFIETGYFSTQPESSYNPAIRMAQDELLIPLGSVAATSFAIGFVHRFLADRLKSNWISTLGWPLLNMTYYFFMRPEFDRYTALRLLPSIGDATMVAAYGEDWAGAATPWLRTANTIYVGLEAIWPELKAEISAYRQCKVQPVVIEGSQSAADLSILTCPVKTSASNNKPALFIDFLDTDEVSTDSPLMKGLYQLREICSSISISKLMLVYEHSPDGGVQLRVFPQIGSGWQKPKVLEINNLQGGGWWSDLNFAAMQIQNSQPVLPPLSPSMIEGIGNTVSYPHESHSVDVDSARLEPVAGLFTLPQENDAFWFRLKPGSLLPGGYQPLPEVVLSLNSKWLGSSSQAKKFRKHSLIPETMRLPWRITQLGLMSFIRSQSIKAAEKLARSIEESIVLPGTLLGKGIIPDQILPHSEQTYDLQIDGLGTPERVTIETNDGKRLQGLLIRSNSAHDTGERTLHIHYHGNGETSHLAGRALFDALKPDNQSLAEFCNDQGVDILIPEYRGYRNDLEPVNGQTLLDDANLFYRLLSNQYRRVTVSGWSLGSGMAAWVSGQNNPDSTILLSPYTSLARVGRDMFMGIKIPKWLVKFNMETDQNIQHISPNTRIYLRHGSQDKVINPQNTQDLYNILNGSSRDNVDMRILRGRDHINILGDSGISDIFARVLKRE